MNRPPIITLCSDFGHGPFVGLMKGVILSICPEARLVDLSHQIPPQDVAAGSLVLSQALDVFGPGAIHLAVVDPGVGTERRGLVVRARSMLWVGPDNGLFTPVLEADPAWQAWELTNRRFFRPKVSRTFHGRDVFAPVAAHLAMGAAPDEMGPAIDDPVRLDIPRPFENDGVLQGQVVTVDTFGNLITNLDQANVREILAGQPGVVRMGELTISGLSHAYGEAAPGQALALFNSMDLLELAMNQGDLCSELGLGRTQVIGMAVTVAAGE